MEAASPKHVKLGAKCERVPEKRDARLTAARNSVPENEHPPDVEPLHGVNHEKSPVTVHDGPAV